MRFPLALPLLAATAAAPAIAQDTAPPRTVVVTGGATLASDYRFRGISRSGDRFAAQGTLGVSHVSGAYVGVWGSSIHGYAARGGDEEIDLYGGYKTSVRGTTIDGGLLYYAFPGSRGAKTDFFEPYLNASRTLGPVTAKIGLDYAWKQRAQACAYDPRCAAKRREDSLYTYGEISGGIPGTGVSLTAHLGESWGRSALTNGLKNYADYSVTAAYAWKALTFSASYVDTDIKRSEFLIPSGRNPVKAGFVGAVAVSF